MYHVKPRIQSLLIWSKDIPHLTPLISHIREEFDEQIYPFAIDQTPFTDEDLTFEVLERKIEGYDFHLIKIYADRLELLLKNNERHAVEHYIDLEEGVEHLCRKILAFMREFESDGDHH